MSQDQLTYRRAASAATVGLVVQAALTLVVMILGLYAHSPAIQAAGWYLLGGLPIWGVLVALYHQHRLERIEALEVAGVDAGAASLFTDQAENLQLAGRRLKHLYKWGLGAVSLAVAVYLVISGLVLLSAFRQAYLDGTLASSAMGDGVSTMGVMLIAAAAVFVAFVVARFESGMAAGPTWGLLRGPAGYMMGNCLALVLVLFGLLLAHYGNTTVLGWLAAVIPSVMVVMGAEVFLSLLLGFYRPRRPGEVSQPAFDSRLLGWMVSPGSIAKAVGEALNYQFGFEVSRSWFYQLLARAVVPLVVFGLGSLILMSSVVVVAPHEQAVATRFGRIRGAVMGPGLHVVLPWPLSRIEKYTVGRVHQVVVGSASTLSDPDEPFLWTGRHAEHEEYLIAAPTPLTAWRGEQGGEDAQTSGVSLVGAQVAVQYRLSDPKQYISTARDPEGMITALADRRLNAYLMTHDIDTLLGPARTTAGQELRQQIQADVQAAGLGMEVVFVGIVGIHPPADGGVAAAFLEQIGSLQERQSRIEQAKREAIETLAAVAGSQNQAIEIDRAIMELQEHQEREGLSPDPDAVQARENERRRHEVRIEQLLTSARGLAAKLIYEARADRWERAISERAMAERFSAEMLAYLNAPGYYRARRYLDALAEGLGDSRKYILVGDHSRLPVFRIDLKDAGSTIDSLLDPDR